MVRSGVASASGITVKGRATNIVESSTPALRISNISEKGIQHLAGQTRVQVEFVMMSTKVLFVSSILSRGQNSIVVALPLSLVSIERRKNARYNCTDGLMAFIDLSVWKPEEEDATAPPFYPVYRTVASYVGVADVSFGGLCALTRFPAVTTALKRGMIDDRAKLVLPMQQPLDISLEIRWFKRIREYVKESTEPSAYMRSYRFGAEFINPSEQVRLAVRQFIQQLAQADAI